MNVTFACPNCEATIRHELRTGAEPLHCAACQAIVATAGDAIAEDGTLARCLVCPSRELFVRKDFPQRLGVAIVAVGFVLSSVAWYDHRPLWSFAILFLTAGIDVVLYLTMGEALVCYRCNAHYRDVENLEEHTGFNLETHERFRQQAAREEIRNSKS